MNTKDQRARALHLFSGGLDSQLAASLLVDQGIHVDALVLDYPFFDLKTAQLAAERLGITVHTFDFTASFWSALSRCIEMKDTSAASRSVAEAMIDTADAYRRNGDFDFISTGDIANQDDGAQHIDYLTESTRNPKAGGLVVRPLTAKRLPESLPEQKGWLVRSSLLDFEGRGRKVQKQLAEAMGLQAEPSLMTPFRLIDELFLHRICDLMHSEGLQDGRKAISWLRTGRHFRLGPATKLILGRNEHENAYIEGHADLYDRILKVEGSPGPTGLLPFTATEDELNVAAAICARYASSSNGSIVRVRVRSSRDTRFVEVTPCSDERADTLKI